MMKHIQCKCNTVSFGRMKSGLSDIIYIDECILFELKELWNLSIKTIESCCGHNITYAYIIIDSRCNYSIRKINDLGYLKIFKNRNDLYYSKYLY